MTSSTALPVTLSTINYSARIDEAARLIGEGTHGGVLIVTSQPLAYRNRHNEHPFRQDSFLHYLTGFNEHDCALVICGQQKKGERVFMFLRDKDPMAELWDGIRLGVAGAKKSLPVDDAFPMSELWDKIPTLLKDSGKLYFHLGRNEKDDEHVIRSLIKHRRYRGRTIGANLPVMDSDEIASVMRIHKRPEEIERMRHAAAITAKTFEHIYKTVRPGMNERDVHGLIVGDFLSFGAETEAYGAIVAGGNNACVLHYRENSAQLKDGELLLIDAGCQYDYYASDVTRTFPVGKKFTHAQRQAYEIVLASQKAAIDAAKPGATLIEVHEAAVRVLVDGLLDLGLVKGSRDSVIEKQEYRTFYPHNTSHWIGMDVHDVGHYHVEDKPRKLESGMYFSVEPGLYFDAANETIPAEFRGIGIRIEDDVMVTKSGNDVLTKAIAKEVSALENRY